jgi:DNA (cytosine-5)-methyltransferase 1
MVTVADFFCGAGGFSEGFHQSGFDVVFGLDNWKLATETHDINHPNCKSVTMDILNIKTVEDIDNIIPDTDIIVGSPPCVSFSNSNKSGKADKTLGVQLIEQFLKIILHKKTKPNSKLKYWIMENVPNSLKYVKDVYSAEELGLNKNLPSLEVNNKEILIASNYGSPQGRKRAICGDYILPDITHNENNFVHIDVILNALGAPSNKKSLIQDPCWDLSLKSKDLTDHYYDTELPKEIYSKARKLKVDHGYMGKMDFPDRTNRLCRTIMATESYCSRESIIFPKENTSDKYRAPTIRELSCLMGFPIDYQFEGGSSTNKHKQIGNAVCVHLSKALADAIKKDMDIELNKIQRKIVKCKKNLNVLEYPLFMKKFSLKPRKMNSKFHSHVPEMKINQLRVELDNMESDFDNEQFVWKSSLHKGSGKNAIKINLTNDKLESLLKKHKSFKEINKFVKEHINKKNINNSLIFQQKNCNVEVKEKHYSPTEILELISETIKKLNLDDEYVENSDLDNLLNYKKPNTYSYKILYSLYLVNKVADLLE